MPGAGPHRHGAVGQARHRIPLLRPRRYPDAWFDALDLDRVTVVGHDWGATLGFHWASRHPDRVAAIAVMEAIVRPIGWDEFVEAGRDLWRAFRTPEVGEKLICEQNVFVGTCAQARRRRVRTASRRSPRARLIPDTTLLQACPGR